MRTSLWPWAGTRIAGFLLRQCIFSTDGWCINFVFLAAASKIFPQRASFGRSKKILETHQGPEFCLERRGSQNCSTKSGMWTRLEFQRIMFLLRRCPSLLCRRRRLLPLSSFDFRPGCTRLLLRQFLHCPSTRQQVQSNALITRSRSQSLLCAGRGEIGQFGNPVRTHFSLASGGAAPFIGWPPSLIPPFLHFSG